MQNYPGGNFTPSMRKIWWFWDNGSLLKNPYTSDFGTKSMDSHAMTTDQDKI